MGENKTFIDNPILLIEKDDNNYVLTGIKDKKVKEVIIPNCVTVVKEGALFGCSSLEKIVLPFVGDKRHNANDSEQYPLGFIFGKVKYPLALGKKQLVKQLEKEVLYYLPFKLKEVVITDSDYIPFGAFYNCMNLKTIILPDGIKRIEDKAFYYCNNIDEIVLPDSIKSIGEYAFYNCSNITKIRFPKNIEEIGQYAFYNCTKLTDAILENENTKIGTLAFEKTQCSLKNYYKPRTVYSPNEDNTTENKRRVLEAIIDDKKENKKEIEVVPFDATLYSCVNYQNTLILSLNDDKKSKDKLKDLDGVLKCPSYYGYDNKPIKGISIFLEAVNMARYITKVILPKECEIIKESCFSGCKNLTEIIFNDKLKVLEDKCFEDCLNLPEKIVFPESLEIIGHRLFKYHDKLPKVMEIYLGKTSKNVLVMLFSLECENIMMAQ